MIISLDPGEIRILPAGEERLKRAAGRRGEPGDDPELPIRWLDVTRDGETLSVAVGPVDYGGEERELWEFVVSIK